MNGDPDRYFVPPYVGYLGWIGVRLDRDLPWDDVERVIRDAYLTVAPKGLGNGAGWRGHMVRDT